MDEHDLTTSEGLKAAFAECGSWAEVGRVYGIAASTLKSRAARAGIFMERGIAKQAPVADVDEALRHENLKLRRQVQDLSKREFESENVVRRIEEAVREASIGFKPVPISPSDSPTRSSQELVLLFSDTHASEVVSLEETEGINEYDWETMLVRMDRITSSVVSHVQHQRFSISKLHVFMLGDMLSGDIHEELAVTNDRPTASAVVDFAYDTSAWLTDLVIRLSDVNAWDPLVPQHGVVNVAGVPGNHPRASKKPQAKLAHNNADWLSYKMIEAILSHDPAFTFSFQYGGMNLQKIAGRYRMLLMHGDGIRSSMPGVPWGGVTRRVISLEAQMNKARKPLDYIVMGHWHSPQSLAGISSRTWINSSVKGADEYSLKQFGQGHDPSQTLLSFHPDRGWTGQYAVDLTNRLAAGEGWK